MNAFDRAWLDLGPEELGGIEMTDPSISYSFKEPVGAHALTRATYANISSDHFTWRGERSADGEVWEELLVIEAQRGHQTSDSELS